jgi:hypothetical protein
MAKKFDRTRREAIKLLATGVSILSVQNLLLGEAFSSSVSATSPGEALGGEWSFSLDEKNEGINNRWFTRDLSDRIKLPGSTDQAGKGSPLPDTVDSSQKSAQRFIDPAIADKHLVGLSRPVIYTGPAWYERMIVVPANWKGKHVSLFLERCLWQTQVWVDSQSFGSQDSLSAPHIYDLGALNPGRHRLVIRVDNSNIHKYTDNTHAYSEMTQTIWNGIVGEISLRAHDPVSIQDVQVYPDLSGHVLRVRVSIANQTGQPQAGTLRLHSTTAGADIEDRTVKFSAPDPETKVETELKFKDSLRPWDEFSPSLHDLTVSLTGRPYRDHAAVKFGVREISVKGTQFALNGRTTFLRGTHDAAAFPLTGYPAMDVESWRHVYQTVRAYGLNHVRYHTYCPPEAAFTAADEAGIILQVELPAGTVFVGTPRGVPDRDAFYAAELDRILDTYGNHPSFCLLSLGNEFRGGEEQLDQWVKHGRDKDPRHLYTSLSNPESLRRFDPAQFDQYQVAHSGRINGQHVSRRMESVFDRTQPETASDYRSTLAGISIPVVSHEVGQWSVYPDYREIADYTGVLRPLNFEAFRESLTGKGMLDQSEDFLRASGTLAARLYREEIERALRTPGFGGFQLLDLHDYPGQGTSLVGILNVFWNSKGLLTPEDHRRYCSPVVPLARLKSYVWQSHDEFNGSLDIANYGQGDLHDVVPYWSLRDSKGTKLAGESFPKMTIPQGGLQPIGTFQADLSGVPAPQRLTLETGIASSPVSNSWDVWVYPSDAEESAATEGVFSEDPSDAIQKAAAGRSVILLAAGHLKDPEPIRYSTPFWNTIMFRTQPKSMGFLCNPRHPALAAFPTESHTSWQWWELVSNRANAARLNWTEHRYRPIVQVVDHAPRNDKLGVVFEFKVGSGKLLICTLDLSTNLQQRVVARQLRHSLKLYAGAPSFAPTEVAEASSISDMFNKP